MTTTPLTSETSAAALGANAAKWLAAGLSTAPADREAAAEAVRLAYRSAGLPEPAHIVWFASPAAGARAAALLTGRRDLPGPAAAPRPMTTAARRAARAGLALPTTRLGVGTAAAFSDDDVLVAEELRAQGCPPVPGTAGVSVRAAVRTTPWAAARAEVHESLGPDGWARLWAACGADVWRMVNDRVAAPLRTHLRNELPAHARTVLLDAVSGQHDAGWLAAFDAAASRADTPGALSLPLPRDGGSGSGGSVHAGSDGRDAASAASPGGGAQGLAPGASSGDSAQGLASGASLGDGSRGGGWGGSSRGGGSRPGGSVRGGAPGGWAGSSRGGGLRADSPRGGGWSGEVQGDGWAEDAQGDGLRGGEWAGGAQADGHPAGGAGVAHSSGGLGVDAQRGDGARADGGRADTAVLRAAQRLAGLAGVARSAGWWWPYANVAILTDRPVELHRDNVGRLHAADTPALRYGDGFALHAWRGMPIPSELVHRLARLTHAEIAAERNAELRRVMLEHFGYERYLREAGARRLGSDACGVLWQLRFADDEPLTMVEVINSTPEPDGTSRIYWLRVPPTTRTPREGVAWTFGLTEQEYQPLVET
ncbi:hypothetical protein GCM10009827_039970 [Dactylosporangium maewongense]|uniref:DUF6745 domain-containing protein n=1 Tax=Dactylosporangium maewongense TaxID=634393 RepID=A0ABN2AIR4_9ACTN